MQKGIFYDRPDKYKHSMAFTSKVSPIVSSDVDKYLSLASQENFKKYLPKNIDFEKKIDFLGICGEAFLANRLNLNDDGIKTQEALKVADLFPLSFIDANHSRKDIIGVIIQSSFAEFGTGKEISREEASRLTSPFSVILSGIVWRVANPNLAEAIEASSDPSSEWYNKLYYSWELMFSETELILIDAKKTNFEDGEFVTDAKKISELEGKLKAYGGKGFDGSGKKIGRIPVGDVIPLGLGIVEDPAGQVQPITAQLEESQASNNQQDIKIEGEIIMTDIELKKLIDNQIKEALKDNSLIAKKSKAANCPDCGEETDDEMDDESEHTCAKCGKKSMGKMWKTTKAVHTIMPATEADKQLLAKNNEKNENSISQIDKEVVNTPDNNKFMKITDVKQLTDENLKECKASDIQSFYDTEILRIGKEYSDKQAKEQEVAKAANDKVSELENKVKEIEPKLTEVTEAYNKLVQENLQKEKVQKFSARMSTVADKYELSEKQSQVIAEEIKLLDKDEEFNKYIENKDLFLPKKGEKKEAVASLDTQKALDDAAKNAEKSKEKVPNASDSSETSAADKYASAFGVDGWESNLSKKK